MEKLRSIVGDFYKTRRREFMMVVFLLLLFVYNIFAYLSGDKYNVFAMIFGKRGGTQTQPSEQQAQPSVPAQSVKENQELEVAAQNVGSEETKPAEPSPQENQKQTEISPSVQTAGQTQSVSQTQTSPEVITVAAKTMFQELDTEVYYREDPFKPIVVPVKVLPPSGGGIKFLPVAHPAKKGPCGSIVTTASAHSSFVWPTEKAESSAGSAGLPPLPGMGGEEGAVPEKGASSGGGLKLTGVIFDSQPVALIRFNGKNVNVRINQWVGSCRVLVISRNQVVLSEPNGTQRRLFL